MPKADTRRGQDEGADSHENPEAQRLDRFLWHARFVRTRALAVDLVNAGHVRVNGQRAGSAARPVRHGDILTIALSRTALVVRVLAFSERRGPAPDAQRLYEAVEGPATGPN